MASNTPNNPGPVTPGTAPRITPAGPPLPPPVTLPPKAQVITASTLPNPKVLASTAPARTYNQLSLKALQPGDPEPYIFGRCIADPGLITADDSTGVLLLNLLWSVGEIEEIEYMIYKGRHSGLGTALGHNEHYTGAAGQATSPLMKAAKGGTYDNLAGKCHSVLTWKPIFPSFSTLDVKAMIKGLKLLDPRNSPQTTAYSTNPALCLGRVLMDCGYTMDDTSWAYAADYCDELIASPQEKRWEVGLQIWDRRALDLWVKTWAIYCNCFIDVQGGTVYLVPDEPRSPNHTVSAGDFAPKMPVEVKRLGKKSVPEHVAVNYNYISETGSAPNITSLIERRTAPTDTSASPGETTVLDLPGIQTYSRAKRIAVMSYNKAHNDKTVEFRSFDNGLARTIGDVGTLTNAQYSLSAEDMTLIDNKELEPGRWRRKYQKYSTANYSDEIYEEPDGNLVTFQDPDNPPDGPTPTASEEYASAAGGVTYSRFRILFNGVLWPYVASYHVTVTDLDPGEVDPVIVDAYVPHTGQGVHKIFTGPVKSGHTYRVRVYVRSFTTAESTTPGTVDITSTAGNYAELDVGEVENMHVYILDGDGKYATTRPGSGSPEVGITWSEWFSTSSPQATFGDKLGGGKRWFEDYLVDTVFQTEVWDAGASWVGEWRYINLNVTVLDGTKQDYVRLSEDVSPLSFTDNAGSNLPGTLGRYMIAKSVVSDSPSVPGGGLHVKLPIPVVFAIGA